MEGKGVNVLMQEHHLIDYPDQWDAAIAAERDLLSLALHDWQNGQLVWGTWHHEVSNGERGIRPTASKYRAAISSREHNPFIVLVFRHPRQQDTISVHRAEYLDEVIRLRSRGAVTWQAVIDAIVDAQERHLIDYPDQ